MRPLRRASDRPRPPKAAVVTGYLPKTADALAGRLTIGYIFLLFSRRRLSRHTPNVKRLVTDMTVSSANRVTFADQF